MSRQKSSRVYYIEALRRFRSLYRKNFRSGQSELTAFTLATADRSGRPTIRTVLLKDVSEEGFSFYTNARSRKGWQLSQNPRAALCFYWEHLSHQVIIDGRVRTVSDQEADAYWKTRPRESQIGAWASRQSERISSRAVLLNRYRYFAKKYRGQTVTTILLDRLSRDPRPH